MKNLLLLGVIGVAAYLYIQRQGSLFGNGFVMEEFDFLQGSGTIFYKGKKYPLPPGQSILAFPNGESIRWTWSTNAQMVNYLKIDLFKNGVFVKTLYSN